MLFDTRESYLSGLHHRQWVNHYSATVPLTFFKYHIPNAVVSWHLFKDLRPVLEGFDVTLREGAWEAGIQIARPWGRGIWRTVRASPSALWQQTPTDRSLARLWQNIFNFTSWMLVFAPKSTIMLLEAGAVFSCYSHCYVTWCPLTTGIVASQWPSARDAVLVTRHLTPWYQDV